MTTTGHRMAQLAGASGAAGTLLLMIGAGATAGAALAAYSGLTGDDAAAHLMTNIEKTDYPVTHVGGFPIRLPKRGDYLRRRRRRLEDDLCLFGAF